MSRQSYHTGPQAVGSSRHEHRKREECFYSCPAQTQSAVYETTQRSSQAGHFAPNVNGYHQYPTYETGRAWEHPNPEVRKVVNDSSLGYTYQQDAPAEPQTYVYASDQTNGPSTGHDQQVGTDGIAPYQNVGGGLAASQLENLNNGQTAMNNLLIWKGESQRSGPWYGDVEQWRAR